MELVGCKEKNLFRVGTVLKKQTVSLWFEYFGLRPEKISNGICRKTVSVYLDSNHGNHPWQKNSHKKYNCSLDPTLKFMKARKNISDWDRQDGNFTAEDVMPNIKTKNTNIKII